MPPGELPPISSPTPSQNRSPIFASWRDQIRLLLGPRVRHSAPFTLHSLNQTNLCSFPSLHALGILTGCEYVNTFGSHVRTGRRSPAWQKLPLKPKHNFVIGGYRPEGNTLELILVGYYQNEKLLFAAKVRMGLNPPLRRKLHTLLKPLSTPRCPFANLPTAAGRQAHWGEGVTAEDMKDYVWLKPEIVAEIKFTELTAGHILRHPEFVALRDDIPPEAVTLDA